MKKSLIGSVLLLTLGSCVSLKEVNKYSKKSDKVLESCLTLDYSNTSSYMRYESMEYLYDPLVRDKEVILPFIHFDTTTVLLNKMDDETIVYFIKVLRGYFAAMDKLSDKSKSDIDVKSIGESLVKDTSLLKELKLTEDDVKSAKKIINFIGDASTRMFREKKIRSIMIKSDTSIINCIKGLTRFLTMLKKSSESDEELLRRRYGNLLGDAAIDKGQKIVWVLEYKNEVLKLRKIRSNLSKLIDDLDKIGKSHNDIVSMAKKKKLNSKSLKVIIGNYSDSN